MTRGSSGCKLGRASVCVISTEIGRLDSRHTDGTLEGRHLCAFWAAKAVRCGRKGRLEENGRKSDGNADFGFGAVGTRILLTYYRILILRMVWRRDRMEDGMSVRLAVGGIPGHRDAGSVCHQLGIWQRLCGIRIRSQPYQGACMYMAD